MTGDVDRLGVGLVGAGWMGSILLRRLCERTDVEVRALCQRDGDRARALLRELEQPSDLFTDDYEALLDDPAIEAVFLCSPNALHGPQAIAALQAGKHVFCEKPCATRYAEFLRQIELERAHPELVTYVNYILHFDDMERMLRQMVAEGLFGTVTQIQVNYRHPVNIAGDKAWKLDRGLIGDAIGMGIIHALWAMLEAMAPQATPCGVFATKAPALVRAFEAEPIWSIQVLFDDGATGVCLGNIESGVGYDAYHCVFGTEGAFVFDSLEERPRKVRYRSGRLTKDRWVYPLDRDRCVREGYGLCAWVEGTRTPDSGDVLDHKTAECVAHFLDCVRSGQPSALGFAATRAVAEVGWGALMSAELGRLVTLPLDPGEAEDFFGT